MSTSPDPITARRRGLSTIRRVTVGVAVSAAAATAGLAGIFAATQSATATDTGSTTTQSSTSSDNSSSTTSSSQSDAPTSSSGSSHRLDERVMSTPTLVRRRWRAIGTDCELIAETDEAADAAAVIALAQLSELDLACSRFRDDSELSRLRHGTAVPVGRVLNRTLGAALRAAQSTDGIVDPTVGRSVSALGYDRDFDALPTRRRHLTAVPDPAPGHWRVSHDEAAGQVLVPRGVELDLGATAKAWAVDRCAATLAAELPGSFLVNFGGDLAVAGPDLPGGWQISVDDADGTPLDQQPVITIHGGALATSSTVRRTWAVADRRHHHIVDPRVGTSAEAVWQTVTVAARTCELANTASTAAVVLGTDAPTWLARRGLHARLLSHDGAVVYVGDWPADTSAPQARPA